MKVLQRGHRATGLAVESGFDIDSVKRAPGATQASSPRQTPLRSAAAPQVLEPAAHWARPAVMVRQFCVSNRQRIGKCAESPASMHCGLRCISCPADIGLLQLRSGSMLPHTCCKALSILNS